MPGTDIGSRVTLMFVADSRCDGKTLVGNTSPSLGIKFLKRRMCNHCNKKTSDSLGIFFKRCNRLFT